MAKAFERKAGLKFSSSSIFPLQKIKQKTLNDFFTLMTYKSS